MTEVTFISEIDKRSVEKLAYEKIRTRYGTIPHPGEPILEGDMWTVPIDVRYPRVLTGESEEYPAKVRFMNVRNIGVIQISAKTGEIVDMPRYYDVRNTIRNFIQQIATVVDKALVKVGADRFSRLPFPTHMHSPVVDVLSWVLTNNELNTEEVLQSASDDERDKYIQHIQSLENVGLVRVTESLIEPADLLIEIESRSPSLQRNLSDALTVFFQEGYDMIESIRQVLGPHLVISSFCYQSSLEYGDLVGLTYGVIEKNMMERYRQEKRIKIPRYLAQLESIEMLRGDVRKGEPVWFGTEDVFSRIRSEAEILEPFEEYLLLQN